MAIINLFNLSGKTALVTGSSRGIGRAIALGLAEQGADVVFNCAANLEMAQEAAKEATKLGIRARAIQADMAQSNAPSELFDKTISYLGHLDILVLNVSINNRKPWLGITNEDFDRVMTINLRSAMTLMQLAVPGMIERKWGRIVTIGSIQQVKPHPAMLVYAASKSAQLNMAQNLAKQLAKYNITVNNLAPGVIVTDRNIEALADPEYRQRVLGQVPANFFGKAEDCVGAALLLCSEAGRYINGVDLLVDGGMHL